MTLQTNDNSANPELSIDELDTVAGGGLENGGWGAPGRRHPVEGGSNFQGPYPGQPTMKQF